MSDDEVLDAMLQRAMRDERRVASLFPYVEGGTEGLAVAFGCSPDELRRLGLCLRPRGVNWSEDVEEIAALVGAPFDSLAEGLQRAMVREGFARVPVALTEGGLLAARDREDDE